MRFNRKYAKRGRFGRYKRRRWFRRNRRFAKAVTRIIDKVSERKWIYYEFTSATGVDWNGELYALSMIPGGTGAHERIGQSVKAIKFNCSWALENAAGVAIVARVLFFAVKNNVGTPTAADVLHNIGNIYAPQSQYNRDSYIAYKVLYDKLVFSNYYNLTVMGRIHLMFKKHKINWFSANDVDWIDGQLYLLVITDVNASKPSFKGTMSLTYIDA